MLSCHQVADYFLSLQDEESGDLISNLKLQKLAYYAQGAALAIKDAPMFPEPIYAWKHGPVVPDLYHKFKAHGSSAIPKSATFDLNCLTREDKEILDEVYSVYGQFSGWKLRNMTHSEPPWIQAEKYETEITQDSMKSYFKSILN